MAEETINKTDPETTGTGVEKNTEEKQPNLLAKLLAELTGKSKEDSKASTEDNGVGTAKEDQKKASVAEKMLTEADLQAALEKEKEKWEAAQQEQARLAQLAPDERAKAEAETKDKELQELRAQALQRQLQDAATDKLKNDGYPIELAGVISYSDKETADKQLEVLEQVFAKSLAAAVNEKLRGKTPAGLGGAANAENSMKDLIAKNIRGGFTR